MTSLTSGSLASGTTPAGPSTSRAVRSVPGGAGAGATAGTV
jgi:hypothetical protein